MSKDDYRVRKFINKYGLGAVDVRVSSNKDGSFSTVFQLQDGDASIYETFFIEDIVEDSDVFYEAVQFFQLLRKVGEEVVDELTSRWLTLKEIENAEAKGSTEKRQESSAEGSDRADEGGTAEFVQEELDFNS